jgi:DNA-binding transcriptional LysR family regulator
MVQQRSARPQGTIRLGFVGSFARRSLPLLLKASRRRNPSLSYELFDLNSGEQLNALRRGSLDVAIIRGPLSCPGIEMQTLYEEDLILALPADLGIAKGTAPKPRALDGCTYVQFSPSIEPAVYHQTEERAREARLSLEPLHLVNRTSALMALISAGIGVSLIPEALSVEPHPGVTYHPVAGSTRSAMCLAWQSDSTSEAIASFLSIAIESAEELAPLPVFSAPARGRKSRRSKSRP